MMCSFKAALLRSKQDTIHFKEGINAVSAQAIENLPPFFVACLVAENGEVNVRTVVVIALVPESQRAQFYRQKASGISAEKNHSG